MATTALEPIVFDFETDKIAPGNGASAPVCLSYATKDSKGLVVGDDMAKTLEAILDGVLAGKYIAINFSIAFDFMVTLAHMPHLWEKVWKAYAMGGVLCARVREKLLDIAEGTHGGERDHRGRMLKKKYDLGDVTKRHFDVELDKGDDSWRTRYSELRGVPLEEWPQRAKDYAIDDSVWVLELFLLQESRAYAMRYKMPDQEAQTRADLALRLMSGWGVRTDGPAVEKLAIATRARMAELRVDLQMEGLIRKGKKQTKNMKAIRAMVERSFSGGAIPKSKPSDKFPQGQTKTDSDTLEMCDEPIAEVLHEYNTLEKSASAFIEKMFQGVDHPIHPFFNVLVNSGRTSCSSPNLQQQPRVPGVRECFIPTPLVEEVKLVRLADGDGLVPEEYVFATCDYDSQELRCWSQICLDLLGDSTLARKYQADPEFDPHLDFAANMLHLDYSEAGALYRKDDEEVIEYRQQAKPANFGFPVGMGFKKFRKYARGYGLILSEEEAKELRSNWYIQWPEAKPYFDEMNRIVGRAGLGTVIQLRSNRRRGLCRYTVAANTFFQGLAADASKLALWLVSNECYNVPSSPLYGCRPVVFMHDEIMLIAPLSYAAEAVARLEELMIQAMEPYTPDVPVRASGALMRRWRKGAKPKFNATGRLIPYEDAMKVAA